MSERLLSLISRAPLQPSVIAVLADLALAEGEIKLATRLVNEAFAAAERLSLFQAQQEIDDSILAT